MRRGFHARESVHKAKDAGWVGGCFENVQNVKTSLERSNRGNKYSAFLISEDCPICPGCASAHQASTGLKLRRVL